MREIESVYDAQIAIMSCNCKNNKKRKTNIEDDINMLYWMTITMRWDIGVEWWEIKKIEIK